MELLRESNYVIPFEPDEYEISNEENPNNLNYSLQFK